MDKNKTHLFLLISLMIFIFIPNTLFSETKQINIKTIYMGEVDHNLNGEKLIGVDYRPFMNQNCPGSYGCIYLGGKFLWKNGFSSPYYIDRLAVSTEPYQPYDETKSKTNPDEPYSHTDWIRDGTPLIYEKGKRHKIVVDERELLRTVSKEFMNHPANVKRFLYDYVRDRYYDDQKYFEAYNRLVDKLLYKEQPKIVHFILSKYLQCINYKELGLPYNSVAECMNDNMVIDYNKEWKPNIKEQTNVRYLISAEPLKLNSLTFQQNPSEKFKMIDLPSTNLLVIEGYLNAPITFYYYEPADDSYGYNVLIHYFLRLNIEDSKAKQGSNTNYIYYEFIVKRNLGDFIDDKITSWDQVVDGNIMTKKADCKVEDKGDIVCIKCEAKVTNNVNFPLTFDVYGVAKIRYKFKKLIDGWDKNNEIEKKDGKCSYSDDKSTEGGRQKVDIDYDDSEWFEDKDEYEDKTVIGAKETKTIVRVEKCFSKNSLRPEVKVCYTSTKKSCENNYNFYDDLQTIPGIGLSAYICGAVAKGSKIIELDNLCPRLSDGTSLYYRKTIDPEKLVVEFSLDYSVKEINKVFDGWGVQGVEGHRSDDMTVSGKSAKSLDCDDYATTFEPSPSNETNETNTITPDDFPDPDGDENKELRVSFPLRIRINAEDSTITYTTPSGIQTKKTKYSVLIDTYYTFDLKIDDKYKNSFLSESLNNIEGWTDEITGYDTIKSSVSCDNTGNCHAVILSGDSPPQCTISIKNDKVESVSCDNDKIKSLINDIRTKLWLKKTTASYLSSYGGISSKAFGKIYYIEPPTAISDIKKVLPSNVSIPKEIAQKYFDYFKRIGLAFGVVGPSPKPFVSNNAVIVKGFTTWDFQNQNMNDVLTGSYVTTSPVCVANNMYYSSKFPSYGCVESWTWGNIRQNANGLIFGNAKDLGINIPNAELWECLKGNVSSDAVFFCVPRVFADNKLDFDGATMVDSNLIKPSEQTKNNLQGFPVPLWIPVKISQSLIYYGKLDRKFFIFSDVGNFGNTEAEFRFKKFFCSGYLFGESNCYHEQMRFLLDTYASGSFSVSPSDSIDYMAGFSAVLDGKIPFSIFFIPGENTEITLGYNVQNILGFDKYLFMKVKYLRNYFPELVGCSRERVGIEDCGASKDYWNEYLDLKGIEHSKLIYDYAEDGSLAKVRGMIGNIDFRILYTLDDEEWKVVGNIKRYGLAFAPLTSVYYPLTSMLITNMKYDAMKNIETVEDIMNMKALAFFDKDITIDKKPTIYKQGFIFGVTSSYYESSCKTSCLEPIHTPLPDEDTSEEDNWDVNGYSNNFLDSEMWYLPHNKLFRSVGFVSNTIYDKEFIPIEWKIGSLLASSKPNFYYESIVGVIKGGQTYYVKYDALKKFLGIKFVKKKPEEKYYTIIIPKDKINQIKSDLEKKVQGASDLVDALLNSKYFKEDDGKMYLEPVFNDNTYKLIKVTYKNYIKGTPYWFDVSHSVVPVFNDKGKMVTDIIDVYKKTGSSSYEYILYNTFGEGFDYYMLIGRPKLSKFGATLGEKYGKEKFINAILTKDVSLPALESQWLKASEIFGLG